MRAGDRQHLGVRLLDDIALGAETASDDDLAVLGERFTDGVERFFNRTIDKAAGVDHHQIGVLVRRRDRVAFRAQLREYAFGIDQGLGAAQRNKAYFFCGHT